MAEVGRGSLALIARGRVLIVCAAAMMALGAQAAAAGAAACPQSGSGPTTPPPSDSFYTPPNPIPAGSPGTVIRSRSVCLGSIIPSGYQAWDVMYLSTGAEDAQGNPSAYNAVPSVATGLIVAPTSAGPHPLFVIAEPEDANSTLKAPSYTDAQSPPWNLRWSLANGWDVLIPDHEGPDSAYGSMPISGHATLDGIRAAENLSGIDGLDGTNTKVGLWGYSGGAGATVWASEMAPRYAPELNIVGVTEGGVPHDAHALFDAVNNGYLAPGLAFGIAIGLNSAYPNILPMSLLNDAGQTLAANMRATGNTSYASGAPQHIEGYTVCGCNPTDLPLQFPAIVQLSHQIDSGQAVPKAPLFIYHSYNDELIPIQGVEQLVQYYCSGGATVDFRVNFGDEHVSNAVAGAPEAMTYLMARFNGVPAPNTCGLPDNGGVIPPSPVPAQPIPPVAATSTALSASLTPVPVGHAVTYTATVSPSDNNGTVNFLDGTSRIPGCEARPLDSSGRATCTITAGYSAAGQHLIAANYSGDTVFEPSTSNTITETVTGG